MRFGHAIIAGAILSFSSAVELTTQSTDSLSWDDDDTIWLLGVTDPLNEIGFYGAYKHCVVQQRKHEICP